MRARAGEQWSSPPCTQDVGLNHGNVSLAETPMSEGKPVDDGGAPVNPR